jgi:hypothetical protein
MALKEYAMLETTITHRTLPNGRVERMKELDQRDVWMYGLAMSGMSYIGILR